MSYHDYNCRLSLQRLAKRNFTCKLWQIYHANGARYLVGVSSTQRQITSDSTCTNYHATRQLSFHQIIIYFIFGWRRPVFIFTICIGLCFCNTNVSFVQLIGVFRLAHIFWVAYSSDHWVRGILQLYSTRFLTCKGVSIMYLLCNFILYFCTICHHRRHDVTTVIQPMYVGRSSFHCDQITVLTFRMFTTGFCIHGVRYGDVFICGYLRLVFIGLHGSHGDCGTYQGSMISVRHFKLFGEDLATLCKICCVLFSDLGLYQDGLTRRRVCFHNTGDQLITLQGCLGALDAKIHPLIGLAQRVFGYGCHNINLERTDMNIIGLQL